MLKRRHITNQVKDRLSCGRSMEKLSDIHFFFLSNAFAWTDQLVVHLASILALCAYLAGWIKSPSKKDALEKKALLPAGANTPTRHGRRLPTSPNPLIIAGPYVLRWRNSTVARSRSCGSFMVSHLQPDHSPSQLSNAQHDRLAFQNVQAPAGSLHRSTA